jgi:hypothetical protein
MLINGEFIRDQAAKLAERAAREGKPVGPEVLAALPDLPANGQPSWQFGYGRYDSESKRLASFTALPHWTGSAWQGGPKLPDPNLGWVHLTASGGHPDEPERSAIRRWKSPADGVISVSGSLQHGSESGNGVRGRIVSSRSGLMGEWTVHNGSHETSVAEQPIRRGDTVDFLTDGLGDHGFDSFSWPVTITISRDGHPPEECTSQDGFRGPSETRESLLGQVIRAWRLALSRPPDSDELSLAAEFLARQLALLRANPGTVASGKTPERQAMTNLCQALLSCNEFLYSD